MASILSNILAPSASLFSLPLLSSPSSPRFLLPLPKTEGRGTLSRANNHYGTRWRLFALFFLLWALPFRCLDSSNTPRLSTATQHFMSSSTAEATILLWALFTFTFTCNIFTPNCFQSSIVILNYLIWAKVHVVYEIYNLIL